MKRKLFIGSSAGRGVTIAEIVASQIQETCGEWLECEIWNRGNAFAINQSSLDSLIRTSRRYHYGIFVATKDDLTIKQDKAVYELRDNVIFEMGLFLGAMGLSRSFLLVEKGAGLPSDFDGISVPMFSMEDVEAPRRATDQLVRAISRTRKTFNLKPIPSAALALGYFDNFLKPFAAKYHERSKEAAKVKVILPRRLAAFKEKNDFNQFVKFYADAFPSEDVSIFKPGERPVIKKIKDKSIFWDIPTTIFTLKQLFDKLPSTSELIGVDPEQEEWLRSEMTEFGYSLMELKKDNVDFQSGITLEVVLLDIVDGNAVETSL